MMKKFVALLLAACLLCPVLALAEETIKIGVFEPMTGATAAGGAMEKEGFDLWTVPRAADTKIRGCRRIS